MSGYVLLFFFQAKLVVDEFRAERQKDTFRTLSNQLVKIKISAVLHMIFM